MKDVPKLLKKSKVTECPDIWTRLPQDKVAKNYGQTLKIFLNEIMVAGRSGNGGRNVQRVLTNCLDMLVFGQNW